MTPAGINNVCRVMSDAGAEWIQLVLPNGFKRPPGFPRGELLCVTERGGTYRFSIAKMLRWVAKAQA